MLALRAIGDVTVAYVVSLQRGQIAPLGANGVPSGFVKTAVVGPLAVGLLGVDGDQQADLAVHGGRDKAVYGYAVRSYELWRARFPEHDALFCPGGMGENLTLADLDEETVCLGDIVRIGSVLLQVSQPRQPCFKLALRFNDKRMPRAMSKNGCCGWYYRVIEAGQLAAGDSVALQGRPNPAWPIRRLDRLAGDKAASLPDLREAAGLEGLAEDWRMALRRRAES